MISIYLSYIKPAVIIGSDVLKPIQAGRAISPHVLQMPGDDTNDNISTKNAAYNELTTQYWVWKNDLQSEFIGFFHYRRLFDFRQERKRKLTREGYISAEQVDANFIEDYGLDQDTMLRTMRGASLILPTPFDVRHVDAASVREQYRFAENHDVLDLDRVGHTLLNVCPSYYPTFEAMCNGTILFPNNMFIMKRNIFLNYCEWLFDVLLHLEHDIDIDGRNPAESRALGYIAERLFTTYVLHNFPPQTTPGTIYLRRVFIENTHPLPAAPAVPVTSLPVISIATVTDAAYIPHVSALIVSILANAAPTSFMDIVVLHDKLSKEAVRTLEQLSDLRADASVQTIDMSQQFKDVRMTSYFQTATLYRLAMPELLHNRRKIIYFDSDMIVVDDLRELYDTDLNGRIAAAVPDIVMRAFVSMGVRSNEETGSLPALKYIHDNLKIASSELYFQAGTIVFDLEKMRSTRVSDAMTKDLKETRYWFLDQDVLNKHLCGDVQPIDLRWNVLYMDETHKAALGSNDRKLYDQSYDQPAVIHFAGLNKPWKDLVHPYSLRYWSYLRRTAWYEQVLFSFPMGTAKGQPLLEDGAARTVAVSVPLLFEPRLGFGVASGLWRAFPSPLRKLLLPVAERLKRLMQRES